MLVWWRSLEFAAQSHGICHNSFGSFSWPLQLNVSDRDAGGVSYAPSFPFLPIEQVPFHQIINIITC